MYRLWAVCLHLSDEVLNPCPETGARTAPGTGGFDQSLHKAGQGTRQAWDLQFSANAAEIEIGQADVSTIRRQGHKFAERTVVRLRILEHGVGISFFTL